MSRSNRAVRAGVREGHSASAAAHAGKACRDGAGRPQACAAELRLRALAAALPAAVLRPDRPPVAGEPGDADAGDRRQRAGAGQGRRHCRQEEADGRRWPSSPIRTRWKRRSRSTSAESLPKWRLEQEQERSRREQQPDGTDREPAIQRRRAAGLRSRAGEADRTRARRSPSVRAVSRTNREELLSMEAIAAPKPGAPARPAPATTSAPARQRLRVHTRAHTRTCAARRACAHTRTRAAHSHLCPHPPKRRASHLCPLRLRQCLHRSRHRSPSRSRRSRCSRHRSNSRCSLDCWVTLRRRRAQPAIDDSGQLQLLPDPGDEIKKAVGQSG